jgi:5-methylcytosine-specific restriction endonuclease McrA
MKRSPLRTRPAVDHRDEPGYGAWHAPVFGLCAVCGARGRLVRHHVVLAQHVRALSGPAWDLRNAMALGYFACCCHRDHHHAVRRIPLARVPAAAIAFADELLGDAMAHAYLTRYYAAD